MDRGIHWLQVDVVGAPEDPEVELLLERFSRRGWVDLGESRYRFYLPLEPGWQEQLASLRGEAASLGVTVETGDEVKDEDWAENWKKFYHPLEVGEHLVVCPSWEKFTPRPDQLVMILDPGSAFGTGYHWSTRLCLARLESVLLQSEPATLEMLDMGTGSGILAVGAWLMGVRRILAVDNDPVAVRVARENFEINQVTAPVELAEVIPERMFHLITANLIASLLVELSAPLAAHLHPGGHLVAGGIIREREAEVVQAFAAVGLDCQQAVREEEWVSLVLAKP